VVNYHWIFTWAKKELNIYMSVVKLPLNIYLLVVPVLHIAWTSSDPILYHINFLKYQERVSEWSFLQLHDGRNKVDFNEMMYALSVFEIRLSSLLARKLQN
jgi:hypothetical protein